MKKSYILIAIALVATLLLSACGTPAETPVVEPEAPVVEQPVEQPTEEAPAEAPVEEPVATLRVWADDTRAPILEKLAPAFLAEYKRRSECRAQVSTERRLPTCSPHRRMPDILFGVPTTRLLRW